MRGQHHSSRATRVCLRTSRATCQTTGSTSSADPPCAGFTATKVSTLSAASGEAAGTSGLATASTNAATVQDIGGTTADSGVTTLGTPRTRASCTVRGYRQSTALDTSKSIVIHQTQGFAIQRELSEFLSQGSTPFRQRLPLRLEVNRRHLCLQKINLQLEDSSV